MTRSTPSPPRSMLSSPPVVLGHQLQLLVMAVPAPVRAPSLLPHETRRLHTAQLHVQMASAVAGVGMGVAMAVTSTKPVPPLHRSPELPKAGTRHQSMDRDGPGMAHALLRPRCRSPWPSSWSTTAAGLLCWCNIFSFPWCSSAATSIDGCLEQSGNARGAGHLQLPMLSPAIPPQLPIAPDASSPTLGAR
jgi:hypothetical protein